MKLTEPTGTPRRPLARFTRPWRTMALGALLWVLLWGDLSWANVVSGAVLGALVAVAFPLPSLGTAATIRPGALVHLLGRFVTDLVLASFQVAWTAVRPSAPPRGGLVEVPLRTTSELFVATTASLSSLVPGTLVVDLDRAGPTLHVHVLDLTGSGGPGAVRDATLALEERLLRAFAPQAELVRAGLVDRVVHPHVPPSEEERR